MDQHGLVTAADLLRLEADPVRLRQWLHRGAVERVSHGVYRFPQIPPSSLDPYMLAVLWPAGKGTLSHDTALELHGLCDVNPSKIHVTVPTSYYPRRQGTERYNIHHEDLGDDDTTWHEGIRIVTTAVAIRQTQKSGLPTHLLRQAIETARRLGRAPSSVLDTLAYATGYKKSPLANN